MSPFLLWFPQWCQLPPLEAPVLDDCWKGWPQKPYWACPALLPHPTALALATITKYYMLTRAVIKVLLLIFSACSSIISALSIKSYRTGILAFKMFSWRMLTCFFRAYLLTAASLGAIWAIRSVYISLSFMSSLKFVILLEEQAWS